VSFNVAADAYDRFMGRYSVPLASPFADFALIEPGQRVLDVGCGPGALTVELVERLGVDAVSAVDPSEQFVAAVQTRAPGVSVQRSGAERLPFDDGTFDASVAQLVVHFMDDPVAGLREMSRVTGSGGVVAACVWDHAGGRGPLSTYWDAARAVDGDVRDESALAGARGGHLGELFRAAGLVDVEEGIVSAEVEHASFESWWEPYTLGVGPAGRYLRGLSGAQQEELRQRCRESLPAAPFIQPAVAWAARGRAC
jgi:SAM-dependent methyltransferase